ncbi:MAG: TolC family protein [Epsilonproteobacteria bacterium]|nr:TolC family protein [Campylobacterota bacterium]
MKRSIGSLLCFSVLLQAATIHDLFQALRHQPQTRLDEMQSRYAKLASRKVRDAFYPTATLFATYEHYNAPTNLRPLSPTESLALGKSNEPLPFATTIERIGADVQMPLFVKELFSLSEAAKARMQSARAKKRLNFLQNEATILGDNAQWLYLVASRQAIDARIHSIQKSLEDARIAVQSGKAPGIRVDKLEAALLRLQNGANDLDIAVNGIKSRLTALTGIRLQNPVALHRRASASLKEEKLFALDPLRHTLKAKRKELDAQKDRLYPKLIAKATWSENYGQNAVAYQPGSADDVHRGYGSYAFNLSIPLFEKSRYTAIEQARIAWQKERYALQKEEQELTARAEALQKNLSLHRRAAELAKKESAAQRKLLRYAKVAYRTGRISEEEYLRYEEALMEAQSKIARAEALQWQTLAQLAVIYGNDLAELVE